jgi:hypothetical protein
MEYRSDTTRRARRGAEGGGGGRDLHRLRLSFRVSCRASCPPRRPAPLSATPRWEPPRGCAGACLEVVDFLPHVQLPPVDFRLRPGPQHVPLPPARQWNTRRVQLVRRDGRDVSTLYGREGGGGFHCRPRQSVGESAGDRERGRGAERLSAARVGTVVGLLKKSVIQTIICSQQCFLDELHGSGRGQGADLLVAPEARRHRGPRRALLRAARACKRRRVWGLRGGLVREGLERNLGAAKAQPPRDGGGARLGSVLRECIRPDKTCPISTGEGTRLVHFVREGGGSGTSVILPCG